jgi:hypothetical protein
VRTAAISWDVPLGNIWGGTSLRIGDNTELVRARRHIVSPGYFRTLGVPIVEGRDFDPDESRADGRRVVIVSRRLIDRHWPSYQDSSQPRFLREGPRSHEIIGVVGDVQHTQLLQPVTSEPDVYFPFDQFPTQTFVVVARIDGAAQPIADAIRQLAIGLNREAAIDPSRTGDTMFVQQLAKQRFGGALLSLFALVALSLTLIGIYGVVAFSVAQQSRQLGIRLALGAPRRSVILLVVKGTVICAAFGIAVGLAAASGLTRLLGSLIFGVSPIDPLTFGAVVLGLAATALVACLVPARQALRIDPVVALRIE